MKKYDESKLTLALTDEELFLKLTGVPRSRSDLGEFPFKLLCRIAQSRSEGIISAQLAKDTGQDARSMTGRLNLLIQLGLIKKYPIIAKGSWTYVSVYKKFTWVNRDKGNITNNKKRATGKDINVDKSLIRRNIMDLLKLSPKGIRLYLDIAEELKVNRRVLSSFLKKLEKEGYIEQLFIFHQDAPHRKFLCSKFLKDLPANDDPDYDDDESDECDEAEIENKATADGGNDDSLMVSDTSRPDDIASMQQLSVSVHSNTNQSISDSQSKNSSNIRCYNTVYSLQNQIYQLIQQSGATGMPGSEVLHKLTGKGFTRVVTKELADIAGTLPAKSFAKYVNTPLGNLLTIKGVDFASRVKFYRYFTYVAYSAMNNIPAKDIWGNFFQPEKRFRSLAFMEKERYTPLPGRLPIRGLAKDIPEASSEIQALIPAKKPAHVVETEAKISNSTKKRGRPPKSRKRTVVKKRKVDNPENTIENINEVAETASPSEIQEDTSFQLSHSDSISSTLSIAQRAMNQLSLPTNHNSNARQSRLDGFLNSASPPPYNSQINATTTARAEDLMLVDPLIQSSQTEFLQSDSSEFLNVDSFMHAFSSPNDSATAHSSNLLQVEDTLQEPSNNLKVSETEEHSLIPPPDQEKENAVTIATELPDSEAQTQSQNQNQEQVQVQETEEQRKVSAEDDDEDAENITLSSDSFSLIQIRRINQAIDLLKSRGGICESGTTFTKKFNEKYNSINKSDMDRKTSISLINTMVQNGKVRIIDLSEQIQNPQRLIATQLIVLPEISDNDPALVEAKKKLINEAGIPSKKSTAYEGVKVSNETTFNVVTPKYKMLLELSSKRYRNFFIPKSDKARSAKRLNEADSRLLKITRKPRSKKSVDKPDKSDKAERHERSQKSSRTKNVPILPKSSDSLSEIQKESTPDSNRVNPVDPIHLLDEDIARKLRRHSSRVTVKSRELNDSLLSKSRETPSKTCYDNNTPINRRSGIFTHTSFSSINSIDIFVRVVLIIRSFSETKGSQYDWAHITRELNHWFPDATSDQVRRFWTRVRSKIGGAKALNALMDYWSTLFETAYLNRKIKRMELDNLDIPYLVKYWTKVQPSLYDAHISPELYLNAEQYESDYILEAEEYKGYEKFDVMFRNRSMVIVADTLGSIAMSTPKTIPPGDSYFDEVDPEVESIKSLVKAIIAAPEAQYDEQKAAALLKKVSEKDNGTSSLNKAMKSLDSENAIVYVPRDVSKVQPGRNYMFADKFMGVISLRIEPTFFLDATKLRDLLLSSFQENTGYKASKSISDGEMLCLLDLVCSSHKNLELEVVDIRKGEHLLGSQSSTKPTNAGNRFVDKSKYEAEIIVKSKVDVSENNFMKLLHRHVAPPIGEPGQYIWSGIGNGLSFPIFERLVVWILLYMVLRPGTSTDRIYHAIKPVLSKTEVNVLARWLIDSRIVEQFTGTPNGRQGLRLRHGWYHNIFNF